jgi:hypothetical protein
MNPRKFASVFSWRVATRRYGFISVDEPLHLVPFLVDVLIIRPRLLPVLLRRDDRLGALTLDRLDEAVAIVALVPDPRSEPLALDQGLGLGDIRLLAAAQQDPCRVAQPVGRHADLGRESAPRSTQRLGVLPPLAPAAC